MSTQPPDVSLKYRDAHSRRAAIMDRLKASGFITIGDLVEHLGVSEMTIRRDVRRLHDEGLAISVRGALRLPYPDTEHEYQQRLSDAVSAKAMVGRLAAQGIREDDVIAIDAGTTALQVAMALPEEFSGTVVTHSIPVINHLLGFPGARTISLGGDVYHKSLALVGSSTIDNAKRLRARIFFLGAAAVDERGVYASADIERLVKQTLMEISDQVVLVIDHRKFEETAPVFLCGWGQLSAVISDQEPPKKISSFLRAEGVDLLLP